jgi:hypothetical protein
VGADKPRKAEITGASVAPINSPLRFTTGEACRVGMSSKNGQRTLMTIASSPMMPKTVKMVNRRLM